MGTGTPELIEARERLGALRRRLQTQQTQAVRLIETHISWILLTETLAFKFKKPVRLPFVDFTTLAARRHFCEEELRLNQRLAPSLYVDVVDVRDGAPGPCFDGAGPVVDVALRMRRFADGALWSERVAAGSLAPRHIDALAQRLHAFHRDAPIAGVGGPFGTAAVRDRVTRGLIDAIDGWCAAAAASPAAAAWPALRRWLSAQPAALAALWPARQAAGRVRECHGDLHLANVLQLGDESTAFDAIEFDPALRWIDVLDDIAFVAMDLLAHRESRLAYRFVNAYLEAGGDHDGLPALRYFMVCRALVRAQVTALSASDSRPDAARYIELASALAGGADARLALMHGLPASGKTFVSQALLEHAGAIRVRSDVERKRLFGLDALADSSAQVAGGIYDAASTERTYARLEEIARVALGAGWPVIVDAAFLRKTERTRFAACAEAMHAPFAIIECRAPVAGVERAHRTAPGTGPRRVGGRCRGARAPARGVSTVGRRRIEGDHQRRHQLAAGAGIAGTAMAGARRGCPLSGPARRRRKPARDQGFRRQFRPGSGTRCRTRAAGGSSSVGSAKPALALRTSCCRSCRSVVYLATFYSFPRLRRVRPFKILDVRFA